MNPKHAGTVSAASADFTPLASTPRTLADVSSQASQLQPRLNGLEDLATRIEEALFGFQPVAPKGVNENPGPECFLARQTEALDGAHARIDALAQILGRIFERVGGNGY